MNTDITIILDRSGSMGAVLDDTIGGFNSFLVKQQADQEKSKEATFLSLVQFNDTIFNTYTERFIRNAEPLTRQTFVPSGWTALLDAMGSTIDSVGSRLARKAELDRPSKVLIVTITDGYENKSTRYAKSQIFDMIQHQKDRYSWGFVFLGANQDAITTAKDFGIGYGQTMTYAANPLGTQGVYGSLGDYVSNFSQAMSAGAAASTTFSSHDRSLQTQAGVPETISKFDKSNV